MLRMTIAQQCFGFFDEGIEDSIYDIHAIRTLSALILAVRVRLTRPRSCNFGIGWSITG